MRISDIILDILELAFRKRPKAPPAKQSFPRAVAAVRAPVSFDVGMAMWRSGVALGATHRRDS